MREPVPAGDMLGNKPGSLQVEVIIKVLKGCVSLFME